MPRCTEMKQGQVYACKECGLKLKVIDECSCEESECSCAELQCCDKPMQLVAKRRGFGTSVFGRKKFGG
jgi:hypothetical protein